MEEYMHSFPVSRKNDLVVQELDEEVLVYDLLSNKAMCLNRTSSLVWRNCDGVSDPDSIAAKVGTVLGTEVPGDVVLFAINELEKASLIERADAPVDGFGGLSRREILKKIGVAGAFALPVVTSLVAPTAAHAQYCILNAPGCNPSIMMSDPMNCTVPTDCCSCMCTMMGRCME